MKRIIVSMLLLLGLFALPSELMAQNPHLSVSVVGFPDTAHVNQQYNFSFIITNNSPSNSYSGEVYIAYTTDNSSPGDSAFFGVNQTGNLAPFDTFTIPVNNFTFNPNVQPQFRTGDNVVVVWPKYGGVSGDSIYINLFIPDPAGIDDKTWALNSNSIRISELGEDMLGITLISQETIIEQVRIYNLSGQLLLDKKQSSVLNLAGIPTGIYIIEVNSNGEKFYQKFFKN